MLSKSISETTEFTIIILEVHEMKRYIKDQKELRKDDAFTKSCTLDVAR